jgi:DNA-binding MarR family transcriptional regulator
MSSPEPLTPTEDKLWRAIMRIVTVLPAYLDADLLRGAGLTASEYTVLMSLRESPSSELRMTDLAKAAGLSASRTTRLVDELETRGLVTKLASPADARSTRARIAPNGRAKLRSACPVHDGSVRRRLFDHIDASSLERLGDAMCTLAMGLDEVSSGA